MYDGKADLLRVTVPESGLAADLMPLTVVELEGFIARVGEARRPARGDVRLRCHATGCRDQAGRGENVGGCGVTRAAPAQLQIPVPVWVPLVSWLAVFGATVMLILAVRGWWRRRHRPKVTDSEASVRRWVTWVAVRWMWDAQNLGLVLVDDTTRHRRQWWTGRRSSHPSCGSRPSASSPHPTGCEPGWAPCPASASTRSPRWPTTWPTPGAASASTWPSTPPALLLLRGFVRDPLARSGRSPPTANPSPTGGCTSASTTKPTRSHLPLANLSGITIAGVPGTGKTCLQRWWLCQLAPHPAVQVAVLDGKVSDPADGDYGLLLPRCFAAAGDDLADANRLLETAVRRSCGPARPGCAAIGAPPSSGITAPPSTVRWCWSSCDESHTFVTGASRKDREVVRVERLVSDEAG